jgi:hypothetical protein
LDAESVKAEVMYIFYPIFECPPFAGQGYSGRSESYQGITISYLSTLEYIK